MTSKRAVSRNGMTPQKAATRLRKAGLTVKAGTGKKIKPLDVKGLDLSKALGEARGKNSR